MTPYQIIRTVEPVLEHLAQDTGGNLDFTFQENEDNPDKAIPISYAAQELMKISMSLTNLYGQAAGHDAPTIQKMADTAFQYTVKRTGLYVPPTLS